MLLPLLLSLFLAQGPLPAFDTGVVTGVVKQADGTPAAKVRIAAMPADADADALVAQTQTDADGKYRLDGVPAGRYFVVAGRVDAPTFYPGVAQKSVAKAVAVAKGSEVSGIDFTVSKTSTQPAPIGRDPFSIQPLINLSSLTTRIPLNGRIVLDEASKGRPLPGQITIQVQGTSQSPLATNPTIVFFSSNITTRVPVAIDGTFTFNAAEGSDTISVAALPQGYAVKSITAGTADLLTEKLDVKQGAPEIVIVVSADLRARFRVEGHVIAPNNSNFFFGQAIELVSSEDATTRILIALDGAFAFTNVLPGTYIVKFPAGNLQQAVTVTDKSVEIELRP